MSDGGTYTYTRTLEAGSGGVEIDRLIPAFEHLMHIGLWSNSADAPHYCKLAIHCNQFH
jgi:hypothetical protein